MQPREVFDVGTDSEEDMDSEEDDILQQVLAESRLESENMRSPDSGQGTSSTPVVVMLVLLNPHILAPT